MKPPEPKSSHLIPEHDERAVFLGKTDIIGKPVFWRPERQVNPHITVLGGSGFGKTTAIEALTTRANIVFGANVLVLDFTGEYIAYAESVGGHVINLGRDAINILDLSGVSPGIRAKQAETALQPFLDTERATRQSRILRILAEESYRRRGITEDAETWDRTPPTLKDVCKLLKGLILDALTGEYQEKEYTREMKNVVQMLAGSHSMRESSLGLLEKLEVYTKPPHDVLARQSTLRMEDIFESGFVVLNLSRLPDERSRSAVAITVLQFLVEYMRNLGVSREGLRLIAVLDEAWKVVSVENSPVRPLYKEGRKYGVGVIVSTQEIVDAENYTVNNAGTLLLLKLRGQDREIAAKSLKLSAHMAEKMERMGIGEAITFMDVKGEYIEPFVLKVFPVFPEASTRIVFRLPSNPLRRILPDALKRYRTARK